MACDVSFRFDIMRNITSQNILPFLTTITYNRTSWHLATWCDVKWNEIMLFGSKPCSKACMKSFIDSSLIKPSLHSLRSHCAKPTCSGGRLCAWPRRPRFLKNLCVCVCVCALCESVVFLLEAHHRVHWDHMNQIHWYHFICGVFLAVQIQPESTMVPEHITK